MLTYGCCTKRSILRDAGALMQCQMTAGDRPCWDWRKVRALFEEKWHARSAT